MGLVPSTSIHIASSISNEMRPRFKKTGDVNFSEKSFPLASVLPLVNVNQTDVIDLFSDLSHLTLGHLSSFSSRPSMNVTKGPEYAVTRNFLDFTRADIDFCHCLSPYCLNDQVVASCLVLTLKGRGTLLHIQKSIVAFFFRNNEKGEKNDDPISYNASSNFVFFLLTVSYS